jgi:EAL domain-containing protein (putative c-di-GMP-specific phosphodiesterase class I)
VAEETGQILELGEWVLREACTQAKAWQDNGWKPVVMAVNISAVQLQRVDMVSLVSSILQETGLEARFLELEITERVIMGDSAELIDTLEALRTLGVRLALDDFGTGYSSLSYLKSFPFDVLKIDRSFVQGINTSEGDLAITEAVIALGRSMKLEVLAEGVETPDHVRILLEKGCSHMQGYNFSRSLRPAELDKWLKPD